MIRHGSFAHGVRANQLVGDVDRRVVLSRSRAADRSLRRARASPGCSRGIGFECSRDELEPRPAASLFRALTLTRGFGQSALSVVSLSIVGKWFQRRLKWAMGLYALLLSLGFVTAFVVAERYAQSDWRTVWGAIAWILLFVAPLAWLITRDSPEACGLFVDGQDPGSAADEAETAEFEMTVSQALATPAFWIFAIGTSLFNVISSGVLLFNESILAERFSVRDLLHRDGDRHIDRTGWQRGGRLAHLPWANCQGHGGSPCRSCRLAHCGRRTRRVLAGHVLDGGQRRGGRGDYSRVFRGLEFALRAAAPRKDSGCRADADRLRVRDRTVAVCGSQRAQRDPISPF